MKISIVIDDKRVTDLLHGHAGGYSSWMHRLIGEWDSPSGAIVHFDKEGVGKGNITVRRAEVTQGLAIFAKEAPRAFSDWLQDNDDDLAFDCAWQCIIFGKLVYG